MFLESGIATGRSAEAIGRDFRQMLDNPDARFRRVRNEKGELVPSQPMKNYNPGQGVYRSAKMNALRVAATETNMGYRVSDCERRQKFDFVLGFEVHRSQIGKPCKVCDALVGKYPKDFIFTGLHPFCICFTTEILMNHEDFDEYLRSKYGRYKQQTIKIPQGEIIKDIPPNARENVKKHPELKSDMPQWIRDNQKYFDF